METIVATKCVEDTTYHKTMRIEGSIVHMKHVTDMKDGNHYLEHAIETKDIDGDDVIKGYVASIIITLRQRFIRAMTGEELAKLPYVINPIDYPASEKVGVSKRDRKVNMLVEMGLPKNKAEIIADNPDKIEDNLNLIADYALEGSEDDLAEVDKNTEDIE